MDALIHWGWVTHICVSKINQHLFRQWLFAWPAPRHVLNQRWFIVNWTLGEKCNKISLKFEPIQSRNYKNFICEMEAILSRPCVYKFKWVTSDYEQQFIDIKPRYSKTNCIQSTWYIGSRYGRVNYSAELNTVLQLLMININRLSISFIIKYTSGPY